ncbi:MAG: STAS domain-containing protein [Planctomycetota bacterium]
MITTEKQGAVTVLTPEMPLVNENAEQLGAALEDRLHGGLPMIVLDLSAVPLIDSLGLTAVLDARDAIRERGGLIKLAGPTPLVSDALLATGVGEHFEVFNNAKLAVGSFAR